MVNFLDITLDWIAKNKIRGGANNRKAKTATTTTPKQQKCDEKKEWLFQEYDDAKLPIIDLKDIRLGVCLGKGKYSKVYEINRMPYEKLSSSSSSLLSSPPNKLALVKEKKYAIKVLRNYTLLRCGEEHVLHAKKDLKNEIQILSTLNHENILNIYGYGCISTGGDNNFLIIDRIERTLYEQMQMWNVINDLGYDYDFFHKRQNKNNKVSSSYGSHSNYCDLINNNERDNIDKYHRDNINKYHSWLLLKEKIHIAKQIVDAIRYMHDRGYAYRDLKPDNTGLLHAENLGRATVVKLFDLGTCRKLPSQSIHADYNGEEGRYAMTFIGSPRYMAPEIHGRRKYNEKVDVYSWSILLYEVLTLENAYQPYEQLEYYKYLYLNRERPILLDGYIERKRFNLYGDEIRYGLSIPNEIKNLLKCSWEGEISKRYSSYELQQKMQSDSFSKYLELDFELPSECCHQGQKQQEQKMQMSSEILDETANETESSFY